MFLTISIISILVLGCIAALFGYFQKAEKDKARLEAEQKKQDAECCGQHEVCEKDSLLAGISKDVEYYNDEELDRYRFRPADEYTAEEVEEFQEVLYTMRNDEVAGWVRSLQLRSIELPNPVKDEVFLIIGERRMH
jgi:hypothetical protein